MGKGIMKRSWQGIIMKILSYYQKLPNNSYQNHEFDDDDAVEEPSAHFGNDSPFDDEPLYWDAQPTFSLLSSSDQTSPLSKSPWSSYIELPEPAPVGDYGNYTGLMTSLVREEGHIYSLAASGDLLYTGSASKNIRVWKNQKAYSGFKSKSGLVKAIVISGEKIFTGHQDGRIRVWKGSAKDPRVHKKIGTLPSFKSVVKKSIKRKNYTEVRMNHTSIWIKHLDVISCLSLNEDHSLLYSGSWDKTIKVWRVSDFKCLESISAHNDSVNAVVAGFDGLVFSGSADGTVKAWRRELQGKRTKHYFSHTLLKQEFAVTSLVINPAGTVVYGGCSDGILHFWEREKLFCNGGVLSGHSLAVLCLAAAGNMVFSGSADRNICVWRREDGGEHRCMYVLNGHTGPVKCLAVEVEVERQGGKSCSAGGGDALCIVYSGSLDKSVKTWRVCQPMPEISQPPPSQRTDGLWWSGSETECCSSNRRVNQRRK